MTLTVKRSPQFASAIREFEREVEPAALRRLYKVKGQWVPDPVVENVYGYLVDGTNHALCILYADKVGFLDWELDDTIL